ncbi:MAG: glycerophosphodiester phosphodiesterase family protein [Anaerolineae bacterium]
MAKLTWNQITNHNPKTRPLVMAHRGASDELAENTLGAFTRALAQGADMLETDIRFTHDNVIVIMHDGAVDRTTDGYGAVADMSIGEFKRLKARWAPMMLPKSGPPPQPPASALAVPAEPPPTLEELLQITHGEVPLGLELKDDRFLTPRDAQQLLDLLAKYNALDNTGLLSFSLARLQTFRPLAPKLSLGWITMSNPFPLAATEFIGPFYPILYANPLYAVWARRLGRIVCPLDIAPEPRLGYYRLLGITVVMTNHPAPTIAVLDRLYR